MANNYKYINQYNKDHYKQFKASISINDYEVLKNILNSLKMSNAEFLRLSINNAKWMIDKDIANKEN